MHKPTIFILSFGIVCLLGAAWYGQGKIRQKTQEIATIGSDFKLASTKGGQVDSRQLVGKPYGIFFGFTHCPDVCPTTMADMSDALAKLSNQGDDFRLFFITIDPSRDNLSLMKDYIANFDARIEGLVPSSEQLTQIIRGFHLYVEKVPTSDGSYTMNHTASVFLFDREGKFWRTIGFDEAPELRLEKLKSLLSRSES